MIKFLFRLLNVSCLSEKLFFFWSATADGKSLPRETMIYNPQQTYKKLRHLKDDTVYNITIWALTAAGRGVEKIVTEPTIEPSGRLTQACYTYQLFNIVLK
jgi:hypothetical protein